MNYSDLGNGMFECLAGMFVLLSILKLRKDKQVRGISILAVTFFFLWGLWNTIFYPMNGLWFSFLGGLIVAVMNFIWVIQMFYYRKN